MEYLESDTIAAYGEKEVIWTDRRFEDAESLKSTAQSMLNDLKVPYLSYSVSSIDLFKKTRDDFDEFREGKVVRVIDKEDNINVNAKIVEVSKSDITKADITVIVANKNKSVAGDIADIQSRARINETYAQGSATLMSMHFMDNADPEFPAVFEFFLPSGMVNINNTALRIQLLPFRGYTRAVKGGGGVITSTQSGGGSNQTSSSGGGGYQTTQDGGGQYDSTHGGGSSSPTTAGAILPASQITTHDDPYNRANHNHSWADNTRFLKNPTWRPITLPPEMGGGTVFALSSYNEWENNAYWKPSGAHDHGSHNHIVNIDAHAHQFTINAHGHNINIPAHRHEFTINDHAHTTVIPAHTHGLTLNDHTHTVTIPAHAHNITLNDHTHEIEFGIYTGTTANSVTVKIDNITIPTVKDLDNIDIVKYLQTDAGGKITRDTWHRLEIAPNCLTRISAFLFLEIYTNSRGGGDY